MIRWTVPLELRIVSTHVRRVHRDQLDQLQEGQFVWQPYLHSTHGYVLPDIYQVGADIWRARTALICMDVVEWHVPDRVIRQFGFQQTVPKPIGTSRLLHAVDRWGRAS